MQSSTPSASTSAAAAAASSLIVNDESRVGIPFQRLVTRLIEANSYEATLLKARDRKKGGQRRGHMMTEYKLKADDLEEAKVSAAVEAADLEKLLEKERREEEEWLIFAAGMRSAVNVFYTKVVGNVRDYWGMRTRKDEHHYNVMSRLHLMLMAAQYEPIPVEAYDLCLESSFEVHVPLCASWENLECTPFPRWVRDKGLYDAYPIPEDDDEAEGCGSDCDSDVFLLGPNDSHWSPMGFDAAVGGAVTRTKSDGGASSFFSSDEDDSKPPTPSLAAAAAALLSAPAAGKFEAPAELQDADGNIPEDYFFRHALIYTTGARQQLVMGFFFKQKLEILLTQLAISLWAALPPKVQQYVPEPITPHARKKQMRFLSSLAAAGARYTTKEAKRREAAHEKRQKVKEEAEAAERRSTAASAGESSSSPLSALLKTFVFGSSSSPLAPSTKDGADGTKKDDAATINADTSVTISVTSPSTAIFEEEGDKKKDTLLPQPPRQDGLLGVAGGGMGRRRSSLKGGGFLSDTATGGGCTPEHNSVPRRRRASIQLPGDAATTTATTDIGAGGRGMGRRFSVTSVETTQSAAANTVSSDCSIFQEDAGKLFRHARMTTLEYNEKDSSSQPPNSSNFPSPSRSPSQWNGPRRRSSVGFVNGFTAFDNTATTTGSSGPLFNLNATASSTGTAIMASDNNNDDGPLTATGTTTGSSMATGSQVTLTLGDLKKANKTLEEVVGSVDEKSPSPQPSAVRRPTVSPTASGYGAPLTITVPTNASSHPKPQAKQQPNKPSPKQQASNSPNMTADSKQPHHHHHHDHHHHGAKAPPQPSPSADADAVAKRDVVRYSLTDYLRDNGGWAAFLRGAVLKEMYYGSVVVIYRPTPDLPPIPVVPPLQKAAAAAPSLPLPPPSPSAVSTNGGRRTPPPPPPQPSPEALAAAHRAAIEKAAAAKREATVKKQNAPLCIREYSDVPIGDVEALLPDIKVQISPQDIIILAVKMAATSVFTLAGLREMVGFYWAPSSGAFGPRSPRFGERFNQLFLALILIFGSLVKLYQYYQSYYAIAGAYRREVETWREKKREGKDDAILSKLCSSVCAQETKEILLAYFFLWKIGPMNKQELQQKVQDFLKVEFDVDNFCFDVVDAIIKLQSLGLVQAQEETEEQKRAEAAFKEAAARIKAQRASKAAVAAAAEGAAVPSPALQDDDASSVTPTTVNGDGGSAGGDLLGKKEERPWAIFEITMTPAEWSAEHPLQHLQRINLRGHAAAAAPTSKAPLPTAAAGTAPAQKAEAKK